jgi:hypothetical protein
VILPCSSSNLGIKHVKDKDSLSQIDLSDPQFKSLDHSLLSGLNASTFRFLSVPLSKEQEAQVKERIVVVGVLYCLETQ